MLDIPMGTIQERCTMTWACEPVLELAAVLGCQVLNLCLAWGRGWVG